MTVELGAFVVPDASNPAGVIEHVDAAERGGLELVGIQDHPYNRGQLDTFSLLAHLAARTERVRLFPDVANLPLSSKGEMVEQIGRFAAEVAPAVRSG